jgi:putative transposase
MPRANRFFQPGYVWHITHRCHQREFLLKFSRDRQRWRYWLYQARKRYGLCVLNYIATSNHIHLLVRDRGKGEIARSMQLIAGRTAQEYNQRKNRRGAYWEDRYHATAVDTDEYLARCMVYIDMNMVRAGAVSHPGEWDLSGYNEIQDPQQRYRIIDLPEVMGLLGVHDITGLQKSCREWIAEALRAERSVRDERWTESLAVGHHQFLQKFQAESGISASYRQLVQDEAGSLLREPPAAYSIDF